VSKATPGEAKVRLSPFRGFRDSAPRDRVRLDEMTGASRNWLVAAGRLLRRAGSAIFGDTLTAGHETAGVLETAIGFLARRIYGALLASMLDLFPTQVVLFTEEATTGAGTIAYYSTNTDAWRVIGDGFDGTSYPDSGVIAHRVVPMVYENQYGGLTLHRLNSATHRQYACAGSRSLLESEKWLAWGGFNSAAMRANLDEDDNLTVLPLGLIPPLQMPICTAGTNLGSTPGPFKGSEAWFYSLIFEDEFGELSMFAIPRPPGSAWAGYEGFGYFQVDSTNPTQFRDSVVYSQISDGPPGTRWKHIIRSGKVDISTTGAGAVVTPSVSDLQILARIPQGVHEYVDSDGNDLALDPDPRIEEMFRRGGLQWAPSARHIGRFDGHTTLGGLKPNPYALIVAPWETGALNAPIDDDTLYGSTTYFVAITPLYIYLRSVTAGVATDTTFVLSGLTLRDLVDRVNKNAALTNTALTGCYWYAPVVGGDRAWIIFRGSAFAGVSVGDVIVNSDFPSGTKVTAIYAPNAGVYAIGTSSIPTSDSVAPPTGESVTFVSRASDAASFPWAAAVVPGADADESCDELLRTYVDAAIAGFSTGSPIIDVSAGGDDEWITPGMFVYRDENGEPERGFALGTIVISVDHAAHTVTVSTDALRDDLGGAESVLFAYDTGDSVTGLLPGFVRMFGNALPALLPWRKSYLDQFKPSLGAMIFTGASPGYAQDGVNTWLARNRRGAPATFGPLMGMADLGPLEVHFHARARMRLANPRTGETHNDQDYTKSVVSWNLGARSPYAICAGPGFAIAVCESGFYATAGGMGDERFFSDAIYDHARIAGRRGSLEYAIGASVAASESDTDDYKIFASLEGMVLCVRYWSSASAGRPDLEVRYDFSEGKGRQGMAMLFRADGSPFAWSAPCTVAPSCSATIPTAAGVKRFGALDTNLGTADGRVDELDTGTEDNGVAILPVAYTGTVVPEGNEKFQPMNFGVVARKAGAGIVVGVARNSRPDHDEMEWDDVEVPTSSGYEFDRRILPLAPAARAVRDALTLRITDDGTNECPEISRLTLYGDGADILRSQDEKGGL